MKKKGRFSLISPLALCVIFGVGCFYAFVVTMVGQEQWSVPNRSDKHSAVPGVVIDYSPAETGKYIGSPSIAVLPNGYYIASHDFFGPGSKNNRTCIFRSEDAGKTWQHIKDLEGQWWSTLFVHNESLYIMGTSGLYGHVVIRRSTDGGKTWSIPKDRNSGLLAADGSYHTAPVPVITHQGRIWRSMEHRNPDRGGPKNFRSFVMSALVDADLLKAENWTMSNRLRFEQSWQKGSGWLEGNIVIVPQKRLVNILRLEYARDKAAIVNISKDGKIVSFDPQNGVIDFPGGRAKFTIRYDNVTKRYWSLVNKQSNPEAYRNILVLTSSRDLRNWMVESIILRHRDSKNVAWQYVDWLFEGKDIIAVSRTAFNGAHKAHDANYLTFHRIRNFRSLTMKDSPDYLVTKKTYEGLKLTIEGSGFTVKELRNGSTAFSNRKYVWMDVPRELGGMKYTQTGGGEFAQIEFTAKENTIAYIASAEAKRPIGWVSTNYKFRYSDKNRTTMNVFRRKVKASEKVTVPQSHWTGTILIFEPQTPAEEPYSNRAAVQGVQGNLPHPLSSVSK